MSKLIEAGIGKENPNTIKQINTEFDTLRNAKNLVYLKFLVKSKSMSTNKIPIIFTDFKLDVASKIRDVQLLRYLAVKYLNNVMQLQVSSIIQNNKHLKVKNIQKYCRPANKEVFSCVRKATITMKN